METPALTPEAEKQAMELIERFKKEILKACEGVLSDLYCDMLPWIDSNAWTNFRNEVVEGFQGYNKKTIGEYDIDEMRKAIYKKHKEEIIKDLNQDLVEENKKLKSDLDWHRRQRDRNY